jgi:hypothetical protein
MKMPSRYSFSITHSFDVKNLRSCAGTGRKGSKSGLGRANPQNWSASPLIFTRKKRAVRCHTVKVGECSLISAQTRNRVSRAT